MNPQAGVSYTHTATQYLLDWLYCQKALANMQSMICCNETYVRTENFPVYQKVVDLRFFILLTSKSAHGLRFPVHKKFVTDKLLEVCSGIILNIWLMAYIVR